jgi:hypothetical protein
VNISKPRSLNNRPLLQRPWLQEAIIPTPIVLVPGLHIRATRPARARNHHVRVLAQDRGPGHQDQCQDLCQGLLFQNPGQDLCQVEGQDLGQGRGQYQDLDLDLDPEGVAVVAAGVVAVVQLIDPLAADGECFL